MRTLLFDIDGTLMLTHNGGAGALQKALQLEFSLSEANCEVSFAGRTDRDLLDELLALNGMPADELHRDRLRSRYVSILPEVLLQRGGFLLPGVVELLECLAEEPTVSVGVMTGNFAKSARHKLVHFGIDRYVQWIAGGDDDPHRDDLARRTQKSIRQRHGDSAAENLIVIGDTPADIRCGHAIGARVMAVCTGGFDQETLSKENPAWIVEDLSDTSSVVSILVDSTSSSNEFGGTENF